MSLTPEERRHQEQHVFRLGLSHNKWIIVMPVGWQFINIAKSLPEIVVELERRDKLRCGYTHVKVFDHVEYLGKG